MGQSENLGKIIQKSIELDFCNYLLRGDHFVVIALCLRLSVEPPVPLQGLLISSQMHSATLPLFNMIRIEDYARCPNLVQYVIERLFLKEGR